MFIRKYGGAVAMATASALMSLATVQSAYAAPGVLSNTPLFLSSGVEPNIYFTIDDSGSMDWEPMHQDEAGGIQSSSGLPLIANRFRGYVYQNWDSFSTIYGYAPIPPANGTHEEWDRGWATKNHNANLNYYNPDVVYQPWPGSKTDGTPMFTDADPTRALKDPWDPNSQWVNLTVKHTFSENVFGVWTTTDDWWIPVYFTWTDSDLDGVVDADDEHERVVIDADSEEMQNFANWFQYHRSRINATKSIIGTTINNSDAARMGMRLFNAGILGDTSGSIIHVASMSDPDQKRRLLDAFYRLNIGANGTPMRNSLAQVGEYFRTTGSDAPIVTRENGGECQQNFNIVMGDGYWNGGYSNAGNADGDNSSEFDGSPYADGYSNTLADVAMRYYETDLRSDLANKVPTQDGIDEAEHQHLVTYTIAFGITGSLDSTSDPAGNSDFAWTDPWAAQQNKVDDMWHAAYNGRGKYFNAQQPEELQYALQDALDDISERTATLSAVSINSAKLTNEAVVYIANFDPNGWRGDLIAKKIDDFDTGELEPGQRWSAADELEDLVRPPNATGHQKT